VVERVEEAVVQEEVHPPIRRRRQRQEEDALPLDFEESPFVARHNAEEVDAAGGGEHAGGGRGYPIETHRDFVRRAERGIGTSWDFDPRGKARILTELFPNGYGPGTSKDVSKLPAFVIGKLFKKQYDTSVKRIRTVEGQQH